MKKIKKHHLKAISPSDVEINNLLQLYQTGRYDDAEKSIVRGLKRVSKSSRRLYVGAETIPTVRNGLGIAILTTNKGLLTDAEARDAKVGGEVLCYVW